MLRTATAHWSVRILAITSVCISQEFQIPAEQTLRIALYAGGIKCELSGTYIKRNYTVSLSINTNGSDPVFLVESSE